MKFYSPIIHYYLQNTKQFNFYNILSSLPSIQSNALGWAPAFDGWERAWSAGQTKKINFNFLGFGLGKPGAAENKSTNSIFSSRSAGEERLSLFIWACRGAFGSLGRRFIHSGAEQATPINHFNNKLFSFLIWLALLLHSLHSLWIAWAVLLFPFVFYWRSPWLAPSP